MSTTEFNLAQRLLEAAYANVDPTPVSKIVAPGAQVAWDVCENGLLYVRVVRLAAHNVVDCGVDYMVGSMALGLLRCVVTMREDGSPASDASLTASAEQMLLDMTDTRQAILETLAVEDATTGAIKPATLAWVPLGPQGNVAGGEWTFDVRYIP